MVQIPTLTDSPNYTVQTVLEDVVYHFRMRWSTREACWYMTISDSSRVVLVAGIKVVLGIPLASRTGLPTLPDGMLVAVDTTGRDVPAKIDDLGTRVLLLYFTRAEAEAIAAEPDA